MAPSALGEAPEVLVLELAVPFRRSCESPPVIGRIFCPLLDFTTMNTIGAAKFKQECLAILDRLGPEGIVITKHGKPVAKLVPIQTESSALIGSLAEKIRVHRDLLTTGLQWDAES